MWTAGDWQVDWVGMNRTAKYNYPILVYVAAYYDTARWLNLIILTEQISSKHKF